jgi:hypothetical protein
MSLFLLSYKGLGERPQSDIEQVRQMAGVEIINEKLPRGMVLNITSDLAKHRLKKLDNWSLYESQTVTIHSPWDYLSNTKSVPPLRLVDNETKL